MMIFGLALGLGLLLRIASCFVSTGFSQPNEIYRLLEPLAGLEGYSTRPAWEWSQGALSHLPVLAHLALLHFITWIGIQDAYQQTIALRIFYALLGILPILATWRLSKAAQAGTRTAAFAALFVALWPEFIFRSVRLMDYSLEMSGLAAALLLAPPLECRSRRRDVLAGILLALLFFIRPQTGIYGLCWCLSRFLGSRGKEHPTLRDRISQLPIAMGISCVGTILLLALFEPGGAFLHPFLYYLAWNIRHSAQDYGAAPFFRYASELAKVYGVAGFVLFLPFALSRRSDLGLRIFFWMPVIIFSLISHKEARFIAGFAWLFVPLVASGVSSWMRSDRMTDIFSKHRFAITSSACIVLLLSFGMNLKHNQARYFLRSRDMRQWDQIGIELDQQGLRHRPILIHADPASVPGAFFLRTWGPLCYASPRGLEGDCSPGETGPNRLEIANSAQGWHLINSPPH